MLGKVAGLGEAIESGCAKLADFQIAESRNPVPDSPGHSLIDFSVASGNSDRQVGVLGHAASVEEVAFLKHPRRLADDMPARGPVPSGDGRLVQGNLAKVRLHAPLYSPLFLRAQLLHDMEVGCLKPLGINPDDNALRSPRIAGYSQAYRGKRELDGFADNPFV